MIMKKRCCFVSLIVREVVFNILKKQFNIDLKKSDFNQPRLKAPCIAMANQCFDFDAFIIAKHLRPPIYFLMNDHVTSLPKVEKLIRFLINPIAITKGK